MPEKTENVAETLKQNGNTRSKRFVCPNPHNKDVLFSQTIMGNVDEIFELITSDMLYTKNNNLFEMFGAHDVEIGKWKMNNETKCQHLSIIYRGEMKNPIVGMVKVEVKEDMKLLPCTKKGRFYATDSTYQVFGVHNTFKFDVHKHMCLKRVSENQTEVTMVIGSKFAETVQKIGQRHPFLSVWNSVKQKIRENWVQVYYEAKKNQKNGEPLQLTREQLQENIVKMAKEIKHIPAIHRAMVQLKALNTTYTYGQYFLIGLVAWSASYFLISQCENFLPQAICPLSIFK